MIHTYSVTGMTCNGCVAKVKAALQQTAGIRSAGIQLGEPQATLDMDRHIPVEKLQETLGKLGKYAITEYGGSVQHHTETKASWLKTYKPVLLLFAYIFLTAVLLSVNNYAIDLVKAMRIFMGGFFIAFSFFKMLDLRGFADSYATYDIIAKRFRAWGFIYAFVELILGLLFVLDLFPVTTNLITLLVMLASLAGVVKSVLHKRKIKCACLGTVFNLPMSTVTIIEDGLMIAMSAAMLCML